MLCFHNPDEENGYLSNWYPSRFFIDGIGFTSAEQYMMYIKAIQFGDKSTAGQILQTDKAAQIKALGRAVTPYDDKIWASVRAEKVYTGVYEKFHQNLSLKKQLLETGDEILAECAVKDRIWGIGLSMKDPNRFFPDKWRGENLLGKILMQVRDALRESDE